MVVDHRLRSRPQLLGRLEQRDEGPVPGIRRPCQQLGRARQPGDVHVVSAGVHDRDRVPVGVGAGGGAGVREAGVLLDREGVHVGAQHDGRAVAVAEHPDDAGPADARAHLAAGPLELLGGLRRGALLVVRELRVGMEVAVQVFQGFDDRVEPVEDRMCGRGVSRGGHCVSLSSFGSVGRAGRVDHSTASSRRLVLATSRTSSPRPERMLRVAQRVNPLACSAVILGGIDSSCRTVMTSMTAGPSCANAALEAVVELAGVLDPHAVQSDGARDFGEAGVVEVGAEGEDPVGLHLQLDEAQGAVVEDDDLDREPLLAERDQLAHQHRQPAVTGELTTWRPGCDACTPIACGSALAIDPWLNEPTSRRRPFMRRYRAAHRVGVPTSARNTASSAATRSTAAAVTWGWIGPRSPCVSGQRVEPLASATVMRLHPRQVRRVAAVGQTRQQRGDRVLDGPDQPDVHRDPAADVLAADVDLDDPRVLGIERPIGEIGAEHQQRIAMLHRAVAGREPQQAGHPDVVGVVVLDELLAPQRVHDRRLERPGERDDLVVGAVRSRRRPGS